MEVLSVPRLLISSFGRGAGKSLVSIGIAHELRRRGVSVSTCVIGPALANALVHRRLSGRYVRVLDDRLLSGTQVLQSLFQAGIGADLVLIEGRGGLFDGTAAGSTRGSDAEIAATTGTPTIVVADARGYGATLAHGLRGVAAGAEGFKVEGTLLNFVDPDGGLYGPEYMQTAFDSCGAPPLVGSLPTLQLEASPPPHRFTEEHNSTALPRQFFVDVSAAVGSQVDLEALVKIAQRGRAYRLPGVENVPTTRRTRIAVSDDGCFSPCFQDNLELLRYYGAEIVPFSPLTDSELPPRIGGVYLTGAFLHDYEGELAGNDLLRRSILTFAREGGVVYAEGGGTAFLCRELRTARDRKPVPGVGIIPATAVHSPAAPTYFEIVTTEDSVLGRPGLILKSFGTSEWKTVGEGPMLKVFRMAPLGKASTQEGYSPGPQVVATFAFVHFASNPEIARNLVDAAQVVQSQ